MKSPDAIFPDSDVGALDGEGAAASNGSPAKSVNTVQPPTKWGLVGILAAGSLASNTAFASLMTCQALYLQASSTACRHRAATALERVGPCRLVRRMPRTDQQ